MTDTKLTTVDTMTDTASDSQTDSRLSVSDVAKLLKLSRGSLYNRIKRSDTYEQFKASGITGDNNAILYPKALWSTLLVNVGLSLPIEQPTLTDTVNTPAETASITVVQGNHQQTLVNIELDTQFDLGTLRSPLTTVESYQDPLAMAQQILTQNQQIVGAMSTDLEQRQAKLNQANQALALVEQSNQNLMSQAQKYQIESTVQGALLNQATTQLQQKIQLQQNLGKPVGSTSEQSQQ